jgi:hypothetical protein
MRKPNGINGGRGVMISENTVLDLEGRCSIHLSYGRSQRNVSGWPASAQARLSGGGMVRPIGVVERIAQFGCAQLGCLTKQAAFAGCNV